MGRRAMTDAEKAMTDTQKAAHNKKRVERERSYRLAKKNKHAMAAAQQSIEHHREVFRLTSQTRRDRLKEQAQGDSPVVACCQPCCSCCLVRSPAAPSTTAPNKARKVSPDETDDPIRRFPPSAFGHSPNEVRVPIFKTRGSIHNPPLKATSARDVALAKLRMQYTSVDSARVRQI